MRRLDLLDVRKRFGSAAAAALDGVSLALAAGQVHALLGENGAGKSTLMNVLYGLVAPDEGRVLIDGRGVAIRSPRDAIAAGVGMVHQHFMLAGALTVLDNVLLGDRRARRGASFILRRGEARAQLIDLARRVGLEVDPDAPVAHLSVGQQQRVEILKALWREARVLILDEPTAVLTPPEVGPLLGALRRLADAGAAVVFISHKLAEVRRACDRVTVLRRGRVAWSGAIDEASDEDLARHMVGERTGVAATGPVAPVGSVSADASARDAVAAAVPAASSPIAAEDGRRYTGPAAEDGRRYGDAPALVLDDIRAGPLDGVGLSLGNEILGIAGVDGNGQQELAEVVVGLRRPAWGRVLLAGRDVTRLGVAARGRLGIAHVPNDRKLEGLVGSMTLAENLALKHHRLPAFSRFGLLRWPAIRRLAGELTARFDVRGSTPAGRVSSLSGGNAQKVVLARELAIVEPEVVVATNPTRGLDLAATAFVHAQLRARRAAGGAVLLISSELDELLALCDRITVLYRGRLTMTAWRPGDAPDEIGRLMAGVGA